MLVLVVVLFALLWFPYRAICLYNVGFATEPLLKKWVMFFAKTCIFLSASINPFLYNAMSKRFREAVLDMMACRGGNSSNARNSIH